METTWIQIVMRDYGFIKMIISSGEKEFLVCSSTYN